MLNALDPSSKFVLPLLPTNMMKRRVQFSCLQTSPSQSGKEEGRESIRWWAPLGLGNKQKRRRILSPLTEDRKIEVPVSFFFQILRGTEARRTVRSEIPHYPNPHFTIK